MHDVPRREARTSYTFAEFFAGIGLVRLALERQGWMALFANDIDADKAEMYAHNWPQDPHFCLADVHALEADRLPTVDLFTASFPCNDLSVAGKRAGLDGEQSSAFWGLMRLVEELGNRRPRLILLENVVGFLLSKGGRDFETALRALNGAGYAVDAFVLNAVHWTPQSRPRLFIVAALEPGGTSRAEPCAARPRALCQFINRTSHVDWSLRPLPPLPTCKQRLADLIEDLPDDDLRWWNDERASYFMNQLSDRHAALARSMIDAAEIGYATAFRRVRRGRSMAELRADGVAGCLRTPRGGSGRQILFQAGQGRYGVRLLTARECARLQGVPDSYQIDVPLNQALFGFGDAVCVPVIEWIASHCLAPLAAGEPVAAVESAQPLLF